VVAQVFLWGFVAVVALVALAVGLASLLVTGRLTVPRPPADPALLAEADLAGVWSDGEGGSLTLNADGTFTAHRVCGDFVDWPDDARAPRDSPETTSGRGRWDRTTVDSGVDDPLWASRVRLEFTSSELSAGYDARGTGDKPLLYTYQGDPDEGDLCVLFRPDRRD
jgi:hypothetical protein